MTNRAALTMPEVMSDSSSARNVVHSYHKVLKRVAGEGFTSASRLPQLDFLRGMAILLVLFRHCVVKPEQAGFLTPLAECLHRFGWTGVDLFFVLSGFLIGGLLFKELRISAQLDIRRFLVRRGFKIWPAYFVFLGFIFFQMLRHEGIPIGTAIRRLAPNLLHLQNYISMNHSWARGHTWSLAVEEHFYLALPLFLLFVIARQRERLGSSQLSSIVAVPIAAGFLLLLCFSLRCIDNWPHPFLIDGIGKDVDGRTHLRMDSLFSGVLLAYLYHFKPEMITAMAKHRMLLLIGSIALISPMFFVPSDAPFTDTIGLTMLQLGYGGILLAIVSLAPENGLLGKVIYSSPARIVSFIGVFSYSIYLWHIDFALLPLQHRVLPTLSFLPEWLSWIIAMLLYIVMASLAGIIMANVVERPALALRERLFPSRTDKVGAL